jgi:hypothetical protein
MHLVNQTPVPARLNVAEVGGFRQRVGSITAKATYRFDAAGPFALETAEPVPLFDRDVPTEYGLLPRDDLPRSDPVFEVILLGAAHAPGGRPVTRQPVAVTVGRERRELVVFGDRTWQRQGSDLQISAPAPFTSMPLTYQRAFGGTCEVFIDREAAVPVSDPSNPVGRGFDPGPSAQALAEMMKPPAGFPTYDPVRRLPNVEDPRALIRRWEDAPAPACWATVPLDSLVHLRRCTELSTDEGLAAKLAVKASLFHRAHPDWVIAVPPRGAAVVLEGLSPRGPVTFRLPALRVLADWVVGARHGTSELAPQVLVLLPEEGRFYVVYRHVFHMAAQPRGERCVRLRLEEGWTGESARGAA